ncbi:ABC transporter permease [Arthrobacter crystallopoietes]|uniref:ABC transporter permease n=1 Tax=Micrococcaceae TaxID=1268 RepID=UPI0021C571B9|nr:ABC transporter permease [Arthrobacter sp. Marseille-P9274]
MTALLESSVGPAASAGPTPGTAAGRQGRGWTVFLLLLPAALLVAAMFSYPLLVAAWRSFAYPELGTQNYAWFFDGGTNIGVLLRTVWVAFLTTVICLAFAYPYAYLMVISGRRLKTLLTVLVMVPFWTSLMIRTFAWIILLQDNGLVNEGLALFGIGPLPLMRNTTGVLIGMVQVLLPFMVLPLYNAMAGVDMRLMQAATSLGARPSTAFLKVFVPLAMPGVLSGSLLVFIQALGFYITPALLGSPTEMLVSQYIYAQVNGQLQWGRGSVLGVVLLVTVLVLLAAAAALGRVGRRRRGATVKREAA